MAALAPVRAAVPMLELVAATGVMAVNSGKNRNRGFSRSHAF